MGYHENKIIICHTVLIGWGTMSRDNCDIFHRNPEGSRGGGWSFTHRAKGSCAVAHAYTYCRNPVAEGHVVETQSRGTRHLPAGVRDRLDQAKEQCESCIHLVELPSTAGSTLCSVHHTSVFCILRVDVQLRLIHS